MKRGKYICSQLKAIRRSIAEENNIPLEIPECTYEGECRGTCPRCESEVKYLEAELSRRAKMGLAATVAGIAVTLTSCDYEHHPLQTQGDVPYEDSLQPIDTAATEKPVMPKCLAANAPALPDDVVLGGICIIDSTDNESLTDENYIEGEINDDYLIPEEDPEFPGGQAALEKYIQDHIVYPQEAIDPHIEGRVFLTFVIEKDGSVSNVKILRDIGGGCGQAAKDVVKTMPKWKPGRNKGEAVRSQFNLPITFQLP